MIAGFAWPDVVIVAIAGLAAFKGFSRGFVRELGGFVALAAGAIAPWYYNGSLDAQIDAVVKLGQWPSHIVGMILTGLFAYGVVIVAASVLGRIAKLPILGIGNAIAGALVGCIKAAALLWLILFVALFFPLTPAIRASLHQSRILAYAAPFDATVDAAIVNTLPPFARPLLSPLFGRHAV
jgi:uncharacterized membrane protein required for colicin V production